MLEAGRVLEAGSVQAGAWLGPGAVMADGSGAHPGRPPPAPLAHVPSQDGRLAPVPALVGNNKRDADPRAP